MLNIQNQQAGVPGGKKAAPISFRPSSQDFCVTNLVSVVIISKYKQLTGSQRENKKSSYRQERVRESKLLPFTDLDHKGTQQKEVRLREQTLRSPYSPRAQRLGRRHVYHDHLSALSLGLAPSHGKVVLYGRKMLPLEWQVANPCLQVNGISSWWRSSSLRTHYRKWKLQWEAI